MRELFKTFIELLGCCSFIAMIMVLMACCSTWIYPKVKKWSEKNNDHGLQTRLTHNDQLSKEAAKRLNDYKS